MQKVLFLSIVLSIMIFLNFSCCGGRGQNTCQNGVDISSGTVGWKWDVEIYDKPGWSSSHWYGGTIEKREGDEIIISFDTADENGINDDFYIEHYRKVVLSSKDGGKSWKEVDYNLGHETPVKLSDGTLVQVKSKQLTCEEQKVRLEKLGIEHIWRDDCKLGWDLWPEDMADELREQGLIVWDRKTGWTKYHRWLPDGVVATHAPSKMILRRSTNDGRTWEENTLPDMEKFSHFVLQFSGTVVLVDDTILIPCYAVRKEFVKDGQFSLVDSEIFVLRSVDKGKNYNLVKVGGRPKVQNLNETTLLLHPSGSVVALIRGETIHQSISEDGGLTWTVPKDTGIVGRPLHAICLKSGSILCAYAHRDFPGGVRATLSYDKGKTWDKANEKILRQDSLPSSYIGGPGSVQLDDGTIFTFYSLVRVATPKEEDKIQRDQQIVLNPRFHCYIAGSRYTEDYVRPLGK